MNITFTLTTLAAFIIWNESYRLRLYIKDIVEQISATFGRADWVFPNQKQKQSWMKSK